MFCRTRWEGRIRLPVAPFCFENKTGRTVVQQDCRQNATALSMRRISITDARLENGDRVNIVLPPVAVNGPIITIRRFPKEPITMERLIELGSVSKEVADFLNDLCVPDTTFLSAAEPVPGKQRSSMHFRIIFQKTSEIITIEDNAELQIQGVENLVRLEARKENTEGKRAVTDPGSDQEQSANETKQDYCRRGAGR